MKCRLVFIVATMFVLACPAMLAQQGPANSFRDVAFWVDHWSRPKLALFGPEEEAFNQNVHQITFAWDDSNDATDPGVLDADVQWLKDHPNVRFYVDAYASSRGELIYNLALSQRRANWVKQTLVSRGIAENRIVMAVGWGQLYPVCPELNDACWSRNRIVRFFYSPT
jgi:outer membrane protein OmpA-like peptidoglycan-associated protein